MEGSQSSWLGNFDDNPVGVKDEEDLLVFGYSCKLFRDDDRASRVDQGKYLIPWMGDETHKIDRYDVRGYLNDLSIYEAKPINYSEVLTEEELKIEQQCDEERYSALYKNASDEDTYHEEELKRLKAALAEDGSYHEIGFSYNEEKKNEPENVQNEPKEPVEEPFKLPQDLTVPTGMVIPETLKIHLIIEKTAAFVSEHGPQMEIVIKNKQSSNPQFQFLAFENVLNPYFKHLVSAIKSGRYQPKSAPEKGDHSDSDDDEDYLHPSLFASQSTSPVKIPDLPVFRSKQDDAYSKLVQNLKDKVVKPPQNTPANAGFTNNWSGGAGAGAVQGGYKVSQGSTIYGQPPPPGDEALYHAFSNSLGSDLRPDQVVTPPLEVQSIVDKMAEYVVRSGDDFEAVVRRKQDKRFDFLNPDNQYHTYYIYKKTIFAEQKRVEAQQKQYEEQERLKREKAAAAAAAEKKYLPKESSAPVSFSLKAKEADLKEVKHAQLNADSDEETHAAPKGADSSTNTTATTTKSETPLIQGPNLVPGSVSGAGPARRSMFDVPPPTGSLVIPPITTVTPIPVAIVTELATKKAAEIAAEAKLAEEKLRDRLALAAREKMAQQTRERLLQQERKRKAALFLTMIKSSAPQLVKGTVPKDETPDANSNNETNSQNKKQIVFGPHPENNVIAKQIEATSTAENGKHKSRGRSPSPGAKVSSRSHSRSYEQQQRNNSASPPTTRDKSYSSSSSSHHGGGGESHRRKTSSSSSYHSRSSHDRPPPSSYSSSRRSRSGSSSPKRRRKRSRSRERSSRR